MGSILTQVGLPDVQTRAEWLVSVLANGESVGVDATLITAAEASGLRTELEANGTLRCLISGLQLKSVGDVFAGLMEQKQESINLLSIQALATAGQTWQVKADHVRAQMAKAKCWGVVVSALDEIAWLFNLRGKDIAFNPVFHSYALITATHTILYVDERKLGLDVKEHLSGVVVKDYGAIFEDLKSHCEIKKGMGKLWLDTKSSLALHDAVGAQPVRMEWIHIGYEQG